MMTRLRVVMPPEWTMVAVVLIFAFTELPLAYYEWVLRQPLDIPRPGLYVLRMAAFAYGVWRVGAFHPAYLPDYRAWLERSPWTSGRPLPAGPIALAWEDALPLGSLAFLASIVGPSVPYSVLGLFLVGYLLALGPSFKTTGTSWFAYMLAFGLGLGLRFWPSPPIFLGTLAATYCVSIVGLKVALSKFPWAGLEGLSPAKQVISHQEKTCGWPFDQLQPRIVDSPKHRRLDGFLIGALGGWYLFAAQSLLSDPANKLLATRIVFGNGVVFLAVFRVVIYCAGLSPPISLRGRIGTFRWIIPGYDQVFLGPLCTLLIGVLAFDRFRPPGLDDLIFLPIAFAVAIAVALTTGPSLVRWRLTGQHRLNATFSEANPDYVQVG